MTTDNRMTWGLIIDVLNLLERHGYHKHDNQHTGQAAGVIYHLARVYEGDRDTPYGTYPGPAPAPPEPPRPGRPADPGAVTIAGTDISTVLTALHIAAEDNCDRAETCADCPDQSCPACQSRRQAARAYDHLTARILQATAAPAAHRDQPGPGSSSRSPRQADPAAGIEAGQ